MTPGRLPRAVRAAAGLLISAVCLWLAFRGVRLADVAAALARARPLAIVAAVGVEFLIFWAMAARWQRLFVGPGVPPRRRLFRILNVAQLANAVLPGKVGVVVRGVMAGEGRADGVAAALATIVGEKVVEGLSLFLVAVGLLPFVPLAGWLRLSAAVGAAVLLALMAAITWLGFRQESAGRGLDRLLGKWPWPRRVAHSALGALRAWRDGRTVLSLWAWSAAILGLSAVLNQLLMWGLGVRAPAAAAVTVLVLSQVGARVPSSPGGIGVFHYVSVLALTMFGVEKELALGFGLLLHLVTYLPPSLLGLVYLAGSVRAWRSAGRGGLMA